MNGMFHLTPIKICHLNVCYAVICIICYVNMFLPLRRQGVSFYCLGVLTSMCYVGLQLLKYELLLLWKLPFVYNSCCKLRTRISVADVPCCFLWNSKFRTDDFPFCLFQVTATRHHRHAWQPARCGRALATSATSEPQGCSGLGCINPLWWFVLAWTSLIIVIQLIFPGLPSPTGNQEERREKVHRMQKIQVLEFHPSSP